VLIDTFSWHYVLYLGIPFALLGIALSNLFLPTRAATGPRPGFDWIGMFLLCVCLGTLLSGLTNAQRLGWSSDPILLLFVAALLALGAFIVWELRIDRPMLEIRVFGHLPFAAAALVSFIMGAGLFGSTYLLPLFVQTMQGYTPTQAGLLLMPAGLMLVLLFPVAGYFSDRMSPGLPIGLGMLVFAGSSWLTAGLTIHTSFALLAWWAVLSRVGLGLVFPALTASSIQVLPPEMVGQGSGLVNFTRQLGGAFGVNLLAVMLERRTLFHADALTASQTGNHAATMIFLERTLHRLEAAGLPEFQQMPVALSHLSQAIVSEAGTLAFQDGFIVVAIVFLAALGPTWLLQRAWRASMASRAPMLARQSIA
jgi:EmrB/QacA subfamily drug resistance transporter